MKFHERIWTEFGTKRDIFHVKRMSIYLGKKLNSFTQKRTFHSTLIVMNKKFIENFVRRIWGSNLTQNSIDTMTNVWKNFQTRRPQELGVVRPRPRVNKTCFPKTICSSFLPDNSFL